MTALALVAAAVLSGLPLGPCADAAKCFVRVPKDAPHALFVALDRLGLQLTQAPAVEPLKKPGGDLAFVLEPLWREKNRQVQVRISSLHRPASVWGTHTAVVPATGAKFADRALTVAWQVAVERAFDNLSGQIAESLGVGSRRLKLTIRVNALEQAPRQQAETVLSCLKSRLDLLGASTAFTERNGFLEEELEYARAKDEPRNPLEYHVGWVRAALLGGPKAPCSVSGTQLGKYAVQVTADEVNGGVVIAFER